MRHVENECMMNAKLENSETGLFKTPKNFKIRSVVCILQALQVGGSLRVAAESRISYVSEVAPVDMHSKCKRRQLKVNVKDL